MSERGNPCTQLCEHYSQTHRHLSLGGRNEGPIDVLYRDLNKSSATRQAAVEAIMVAVRERGLATLKDAANVERLSRCDLATAKEGAAAAMTQLPDWTNRLMQELSAAQDQAEFERVLAAHLGVLESLSPREHELLLEAVADFRCEQAT
jgi:hypothetical protein